MNIKALTWLILDTTIAALASLTGVAVNFLIWQEGKDINKIIELNFYNVLALVLFGVVAAITASMFGIKFNYIVARASRAVLVLFVLANLGGLTANLLHLGILIGLTNAFVFSSKSLIDRLVVPAESVVSYASTRVIVWSLVLIALPIFVAALISSKELNSILILIAGVVSFLSLLVLFIRIKIQRQKFTLVKLLWQSITDFELRRVGIFFLAIGVSRAFTIGILDVLIVRQLGSLDNWSYVAICLALVSIIAGVIIRRRSYANNSYTRAVLGVSFMAYAVSAVLVLVEFNLLVFIIFTLMATVIEVVTNTILEGFIQNVESDNEGFEASRTSYQAHADIFRALGTLLPIGILFFLPDQLVTDQLLIIMLSLITLVPFLFIFALRTTPKNPFSFAGGK